MWTTNPTVAAARHHHINPAEFFFVAPSNPAATINFDPHTLNPCNGNAIGVGVNVIPLLTAAPCNLAPTTSDDHHNHQDSLNNSARKLTQLWQQQQQQNSSSNNMSILHGGVGGSSSIMGSGVSTCQDCGNQAKKDCPHRRCRTCCKSRGYDCATHVKSTWVPASRRRERQLMGGGSASAAAAGSSSQSNSGVKKPRIGGGGCGGVSRTTTTASHTSTSNTTPPRSFDTTSSHQDASFKESLPGQVRAPAIFKCVRVTALDDGEDEYAYQAVVRVGGHVFKGFLYDQGFEGGRDGSYPNLSELHLGGGGGGGGGRNGATSSPQVNLDPSTTDIYGASSGGGLLGGTSYGGGNPIN